jgi:hypothetical protein
MIATTTMEEIVRVLLLYPLLDENQFRVIVNEDNQTAMPDPFGGLYALGKF